MDNPDGNRRPVWNPSCAEASQNQYIQSVAAESSTSVSTSASTEYPALAAAASFPQPSYQQRNFEDNNAMQSHFVYGISGSQGPTYQPAQSSFSRGDSYRDMPSGSEEAGYQPLRVDEDYARIQAQPVGSSTVSQSGYHQVRQGVVDSNSQVVGVPRVASPVDSTVSQSAAAMHRGPSVADAARSSMSMITPSQTTSSSSGQHFVPLRPTVPLYHQSEVTTSGGSPPVDISQGPRDLDLSQLHGEAEIVEPQNRRISHINRYGDMDEAVSSISGQEQAQERLRLPAKSTRAHLEDMDVMSGEPDTTQEDEDEFEQSGYIGNSSSIDEAEALHTTVAPGPSQPLPSTSNVIDSVMENEQLSSTQLAPNARMTSLTASLFNTSPQYRPSQSSERPLSTNQIQSTSHMMPEVSQSSEIPLSTNQIQSTSHMMPQVSSQIAVNLIPTQFPTSQLSSSMTSSSDVHMQFENSEQEQAVVDSSAMVEHLSNGLVSSISEYGASSSLDNSHEDDQRPGTSKQVPRRKSIRMKEAEDVKPAWHREPYQMRPYDPYKLWCDVCQTTFNEECEQHQLIACADKIVFSRAWSSLPPCLQIFRIGPKDSVELGVFAKRPIAKFTQFGPFVGELVELEVVLSNSGMPIMVERDHEVLFVDTNDENKCNWMMFVRPANNFAEQNLVMYQHGQDIYYSVTKPIDVKGELKVWYANHYADRHGLNKLDITEKDITALQEQECKFHCFECSKKFKTAIALQKHLFDHEETGSAKVESTGDSYEPERKPVKPRPLSSQSNIRRKLKAAKKIKDIALSTAASPGLYHWKKRSTNIYLNKTLKKYHKRHESEAMRRSLQSMYRKTGKAAGGNEWTCNSCDLTFDNSNLLNLHTLTHAAENADAAEIVGLDEVKKLSFQMGLDEVKKYQMSANGEQTYTGEGEGEVSEGLSQETHTLACPVCSAQFTQMMALVEHAAEHGKTKGPKFPNFHRPHKCDKCWKAFTTVERLNQHFLCHGPEDSKPYLCSVCNKRFMNNSALSCHMKTHSCRKYYECPICQEGFDHTSAMREHSLIHANAEGMFICSYCEKVFSEFLVLKKHIRGFHSPKYYPCNICDKVFPREDKLKLHMLRHSTIRDFMCETCGKQFKRKDKLKEHIKRLHSSEREAKDLEKSQRLPRLKFIPKVSPSDYHRFIYKCHLCLLGFKRRGMLVNHLANKHPGIKPDSVPELNLPILKTQRDYYCQYCDKVYKSSSKRKAHILKNHPGAELPLSARKKLPIEEVSIGMENPTYSQTVGSITTMPHGCEHCHKQYASKAKLVQHQRRKHPGLVPPAPDRFKRDKIDIGHMQENSGSVIHVVEAYDTDGQTAETVPAADLLTQAMSELTQSIQEYRQNTPGAPDLYQVSARLGAGPPTMVQIQTGNSQGAPSTIELSHLTQALQQFSPGHGHIQVAVSGASPLQIPIVTSQPGTGQTQIVTIDQVTQASGSPGTGTTTTQAVSYQPLNLVSGTAFVPRTWTNYTYK